MRSAIRRALRKARLRTDPDFATAYFDGPLTFKLLIDPKTMASNQPKHVDGNGPKSTEGDAHPADDSASATAEEDDPVWRVRMLDAANTEPETVKRDDPLKIAVQVMTSYNYSQLPVTQDLRKIDGMVSWRSITLARLKGVREDARVMDFADPAHETVNAEDELFKAARKIVDHDAVLVMGSAGKITGIVTATDLSIMFREQSEAVLPPFWWVAGHADRPSG